MKKYFLILLLLCSTILGSAAVRIPEKPSPPRLVNDLANMLSTNEVTQLENTLVDFSNKTDTTEIILADGNTYQFCPPIVGEVTSKFGMRKYRYHYGTDIDLNTGDTVHCAFDGMVRIAKHSDSYGYVVVVRHLNGLETLYAHLSKILVDDDQILRAGDVIGLGGNTGRSYGSHLHFEVRYLGAPINPQDIINFNQLM